MRHKKSEEDNAMTHNVLDAFMRTKKENIDLFNHVVHASGAERSPADFAAYELSQRRWTVIETNPDGSVVLTGVYKGSRLELILEPAEKGLRVRSLQAEN